MKPHIAVIGGGITGAFAAYFLARLGARPTLIERAGIASHASGHNAGGLNPLHGPDIPGPMLDLALESQRLHLEHWEAIRELSAVGFDGHLEQRLAVAMEESEIAALQARGELTGATPGFAATWLNASRVRELEPRLSPDALGGLLTDGNARVDPAPYTRAVTAAAVRLGAEVVSAVARGLRHRRGRVSEVELATGKLACDGVVLAPGAWCTEPERWLGTRLPVVPLKGELLRVRAEAGAPGPEIVWREVGVYKAPDGAMWLGGTEDRAGFDEAPTERGRERILTGVGRLLPRLGALTIERHVAGLRPLTPDGRPIVGIPRGWENVCVATGSGRKGMLFGAGLGLAAAELLSGAAASVSIGPCSPDRFSEDA